MVGSYWVCHWKKTFWVGSCDGIGGLAYLLFCAAYWSRQPRVFRPLSRSCYASRTATSHFLAHHKVIASLAFLKLDIKLFNTLRVHRKVTVWWPWGDIWFLPCLRPRKLYDGIRAALWWPYAPLAAAIWWICGSCNNCDGVIRPLYGRLPISLRSPYVFYLMNCMIAMPSP